MQMHGAVQDINDGKVSRAAKDEMKSELWPRESASRLFSMHISVCRCWASEIRVRLDNHANPSRLAAATGFGSTLSSVSERWYQVAVKIGG